MSTDPAYFMNYIRFRLVDRALKVVGFCLVLVLTGLLLLPVALTLITSFSGDTYYSFPPTTWGLRQYRAVMADPVWLDSFIGSLSVAVPAVLLGLAATLPATIAIYRSHLPGRHLLNIAAVMTMLVPMSGFAVAIYGMFAQLHLLNTYIGVLLATTVTGIPLLMLIVSAALSRLPIEVEFAALVAGAGRSEAWKDITLPMLLPAIAGGCVLTFLSAFDEVVLINFLGGPNLTTLPKTIYEAVLYEVEPVVTAVATLLMVFTAAIMFLATKLNRKN